MEIIGIVLIIICLFLFFIRIWQGLSTFFSYLHEVATTLVIPASTISAMSLVVFLAMVFFPALSTAAFMILLVVCFCVGSGFGMYAKYRMGEKCPKFEYIKVQVPKPRNESDEAIKSNIILAGSVGGGVIGAGVGIVGGFLGVVEGFFKGLKLGYALTAALLEHKVDENNIEWMQKKITIPKPKIYEFTGWDISLVVVCFLFVVQCGAYRTQKDNERVNSEKQNRIYSGSNSDGVSRRGEATYSSPHEEQRVANTSYEGEHYPETRQYLLDVQKVNGMSYDEVRYAINEMYARKGYRFKDQNISQHFVPYGWYDLDSDLSLAQVEKSFSKIERKNMLVLAKYRDAKEAFEEKCQVALEERLNDPNFIDAKDLRRDLVRTYGTSNREEIRRIEANQSSPRKEDTTTGTNYKGELYPETRLRALTDEEIDEKSYSQARYAINEMYARYGCIFKENAVQKQFNQFDWYQPNKERSIQAIENMFSDIERSNVRALAERRNAMKP